ncbi:MAG: hypothetical protein AAFR21_16365, partial [Pseudomonadota bacterium]
MNEKRESLAKTASVSTRRLMRARINRSPRNELEWWQSWWANDYSWEGLTKHKWKGWKKCPEVGIEDIRPIGDAPNDWPEANLQDYWRSAGISKSDLITCGEYQFTKFHLPYKDEQGNTTGKQDWSAEDWDSLKKVLSTLLMQSSPIQGRYSDIVGPDQRAQFDGVVLPFAPVPGSTGISKKMGQIDSIKQSLQQEADEKSKSLNISACW